MNKKEDFRILLFALKHEFMDRLKLICDGARYRVMRAELRMGRRAAPRLPHPKCAAYR
jgi:hypothetical protein